MHRYDNSVFFLLTLFNTFMQELSQLWAHALEQIDIAAEKAWLKTEQLAMISNDF